MTGFTPYELSDPLADQDAPGTGNAGTERLNLAEGLMLSAEHFRTEQLYHRSRRSRMLAFLHGSGTVAGLDVRLENADPDAPGPKKVVVTPGLAIDPRGRLIELRFDSSVHLGDWMAQTAEDIDGQAALRDAVRPAAGPLPSHVALDVTAEFASFAHRPEPAFATGNADRIDSTQPSLSVDSCRLALGVRAADHTVQDESDMATLHGATAVDMDSLHLRKRRDLWRHVSGAEDAPLHLARIMVPVIVQPSGQVSFDDTFNMNAGAVQPDFTHRRYSYSAAELALLAGMRR